MRHVIVVRVDHAKLMARVSIPGHGLQNVPLLGCAYHAWLQFGSG